MGRLMAEHYGIAAPFHKTLSRDLLDRLTLYEESVRRHDGRLLEALPRLSRCCFDEVCGSLPLECSGVSLVGKDSKEEGRAEADILLDCPGGSVPLSLKLYRSGGSVNTKSGGTRSFFVKYFSAFGLSRFYQQKVDAVLDESFDRMGRILYGMNGLEFDGSFDPRWAALGKSELPGGLDRRESEAVLAFYHRVVREFFLAFTEMARADGRLFRSCLLPLMGVSREDMKCLSCFYRRDRRQKYAFDRAFFEDAGHLRGQGLTPEILPLKEGGSSFEVVLGDYRLRIRLKPMNRFTVPALKVNCSLARKW